MRTRVAPAVQGVPMIPGVNIFRPAFWQSRPPMARNSADIPQINLSADYTDAEDCLLLCLKR
jgi:hypothetical protein